MLKEGQGTLQLPISLSIAAPVFNEGAQIFQLLQQWHIYLSNHHQIEKFEIIICNDGSNDDTGAQLDRLSSQYPSIKAIHFEKNQGAAVALARAIAETKYPFILLTDADGQFPIQNISKMLGPISSGKIDAVIGIRQKKDGLYTRFGSSASSYICNYFHKTKLKDFNSAFKLVSGDLLRSLHLEAKGMNYSTEISSKLIEYKAEVRQVNIVHIPRPRGKSHLRLFKDSLHRLLFVFYIGLRQLLLKVGVLKLPTVK